MNGRAEANALFMKKYYEDTTTFGESSNVLFSIYKITLLAIELKTGIIPTFCMTVDFE